MPARHVLSFVLASLMLPSEGQAAETVWTEVHVRVYDSTDEPAVERQAALDVAASIMSSASVAMVWRDCKPKGKGQMSKGKGEGKGEGEGVGVGVGVGVGIGCESPVRNGELVIRILRSRVLNRDKTELPLGDAFIDTQNGAGVLATVYLDRVAWVAAGTGADRRVLLGRAVAHELGHLLLATSTHGSSGLMRAAWSRVELTGSRTKDWTFGQTEIAAIKARGLSRSSVQPN